MTKNVNEAVRKDMSPEYQEAWNKMRDLSKSLPAFGKDVAQLYVAERKKKGETITLDWAKATVSRVKVGKKVSWEIMVIMHEYLAPIDKLRQKFMNAEKAA